MVVMTDCTYKPSILSKAIRILALEEVGQQTPHEMIDDDMTLHNTTRYKIIQHNTAEQNTPQYNTTEHSARFSTLYFYLQISDLFSLPINDFIFHLLFYSVLAVLFLVLFLFFCSSLSAAHTNKQSSQRNMHTVTSSSSPSFSPSLSTHPLTISCPFSFLGQTGFRRLVFCFPTK